jgi:hypothetical protein
VRRETLVAASVAAAWIACSDASPQSAPPASDPGAGAALGEPVLLPPTASDIVSGCVNGAPLVKAVIGLTRVDGKCHAEVTPGSVCVTRGGVVRWKIDNDCGELSGTSDDPALEITVPTFKVPLNGPDAASREKLRSGTGSRLDSCGIKIATVPARPIPPVFCEVGLDADYGFYKYGLRGRIESVDPDVEVRPGR